MAYSTSPSAAPFPHLSGFHATTSSVAALLDQEKYHLILPHDPRSIFTTIRCDRLLSLILIYSELLILRLLA